MMGKSWWHELEGAVHNQEENHECMLLFSFLSSFVQPGNYPRTRATIGESLLYMITMNIILHKLSQTVSGKIPNSVKLTFNTSHHKRMLVNVVGWS